MAEPSAELQELDQGIRRLKGELEAQAREAGIDPSKYTSASFTSLNEEKIRPNMQNMQQLVITFISGDEAKAWHEANVRDVPSKWRFGSSLRQYYPDPRFEKGARSVQAELAPNVTFDSDWHARQVFRAVNKQLKELGLVSGVANTKLVCWRQPWALELALDDSD